MVRGAGKGYPELLTKCYSDSSGKPTGTGPLDPTKDATYQLIDTLWTELAAVFPDKFLHLGGDEVRLPNESRMNLAPYIHTYGVEKPTMIEVSQACHRVFSA